MVERPGPILVVDDEDDIRNLLMLHLEREGFSAVAAANGPEALALAQRVTPSLVLLDLMLPGLSGGRVPGERVLEITREKTTAGMSEWRGSCAACGAVFETAHPGTAGEVRNFLMGAFHAHECRRGRAPLSVLEVPKAVSRPPATAACGECGAPTLPVRLDGCLARHQVKTGSSAVAWCEGGGKPPAGAGKPAVPAWARKV